MLYFFKDIHVGFIIYEKVKYILDVFPKKRLTEQFVLVLFPCELFMADLVMKRFYTFGDELFMVDLIMI